MDDLQAIYEYWQHLCDKAARDGDALWMECCTQEMSVLAEEMDELRRDAQQHSAAVACGRGE